MYKSGFEETYGVSSALIQGYKPIDQKTPINIRLDGVNLSNVKASSNATFKVCIGSRKVLGFNSCEFHKNDRLNHKWSFDFTNPDRASFVIAVFKKSFFGRDQKLGQVEVMVNEFAANQVETREYTLHSNNVYGPEIKVRLTVHVSKDGSPAFEPIQSKWMNNCIEYVGESSLLMC